MIHLNSKASKALKRISKKGVRLTLKYSIKTPSGTLVANKSRIVKIKPAKKGHKGKH